MADNTLNVITICGSLRKGSYNASLARTLPSLAPAGMSITPAPAWDKMPIYNHDIQAGTGFPADCRSLGRRRSAPPTASSSCRRNTTGASRAA